jgi:hypothetical protein
MTAGNIDNGVGFAHNKNMAALPRGFCRQAYSVRKQRQE